MQRNDRLAALAAALVLLIGMSFGRFAFTGLYPLMVADGEISVEGGSWAASANYAGYLVGALMAGFLPRLSSRTLCAIAVLSTAALLAPLGLRMPEWLIVAVRGLAGVSSAFAMVAASHWLIQDRRNQHGAPILFAGVGFGIVVSAEIIAAGHAAALSSRAIWLLLAAVALALSALAILMQARADRTPPPPPEPAGGVGGGPAPAFGAGRLILVYGLAGFGYIITATYLPLLVRTALGGSIDPVHVWAVFGLGAVPSCFLWHAVHVRWGTALSLVANLLVQAVGVALPLLHDPAAYIASAFLVGGTFTGTTTIAMPAARRLAATVRFNMLAIVTAAYGVGQIVGPLIAGALYARTQSFDAALVTASLALLAGVGLCLASGSRR